MHLVCIGLSHKTAPVEQREKAALSEHAARSVLRALVGTRDVSEAVALSTCNRTEIYAVGDDLSETEDAMVRAVVDGAPYADVAGLMGMEILIGVLYAAAAWLTFGHRLRAARATGSLEQV